MLAAMRLGVAAAMVAAVMGSAAPAWAGGYAAKAPEHVRVPGDDGTLLDGYVIRPDVPDGARVPVLLWSSPYFGTLEPAAASPNTDPVYGQINFPPVSEYVQAGYAVAEFNARGTGGSEGCFDFFGPHERADQERLVDWVATRRWSNGKVGAFGDSYDGQ